MKKVTGVLLGLLMAGQAVAETPVERAKQIVGERCYLCHGMRGESSSAIYPRLAGQHAEYIAKQLSDFKAGRRTGTMNEMAADLTETEIAALGDYFSAMPPEAHKVRDKEFAAVGYYLFHKGNPYSGVAACKDCHGDEGKGTRQLPRLAGQHKRYLITQLQDFNKRMRTNDNAVMHSIASKLTEFEIEALANYISGMN